MRHAKWPASPPESKTSGLLLTPEKLAGVRKAERDNIITVI